MPEHFRGSYVRAVPDSDPLHVEDIILRLTSDEAHIKDKQARFTEARVKHLEAHVKSI